MALVLGEQLGVGGLVFDQQIDSVVRLVAAVMSSSTVTATASRAIFLVAAAVGASHVVAGLTVARPDTGTPRHVTVRWTRRARSVRWGT